ncbi:MAG TPA: pilus assembly protein [Chloroflexia bacterium]|nr:pilus assembly protein [Chloroflexia bacterium]
MINLSSVMNWLNSRRLALHDQEEGQGLMEYGLILFLVAVVVIAILMILGPQIGSMFSAVTKGFK